MIRAALFRYLILAAGLLLAGGMPSHASDEEPKPSQGDTSRIERLKQTLEAEKGKQQIEPAPILLPKEQLDPETLRAMQRSLKAYYDYRFHGFEHRKAVFAWQLLSSKIIFAIVVLLVAVGIYFSWIQFTAGMRGRHEGPAGSAVAKQTAPGSGDQASPPPSSTLTTFEASASGVKVSSPVLGVILLVISLAFFYLYLVYVYPIEEIF
jgi:hypothetical protein